MAAENTKVYDLGAITFNLGGIPLDTLGGWGEGDGTVTIEPEGTYFTEKRGADGSVARSKTYEFRARATLSLLQTAGANAVLSTLMKLDKDADNGAGIVPILIRDRQGLSQVDGQEAWIEGPPKSITFGPQAGNLAWAIRIAKANIFLGGN